MKVKTSVTLSAELLQELDAFIDEKQNRSQFVEAAVISKLRIEKQKQRDSKDMAIIDSSFETFDDLMLDILEYQQVVD